MSNQELQRKNVVSADVPGGFGRLATAGSTETGAASATQEHGNRTVSAHTADIASAGVLGQLADVIESRRSGDPSRSYVAKLLIGGNDRILKKIGEEATEVVIAAKDGVRERIIAETADLWFHSLVMLVHHELRPEDVMAELLRREGVSGLDEKASRPKE